MTDSLEYFIDIKGDEHRVGRIIVNPHIKDNYSVEVDVVYKETFKIWHHVAIFKTSGNLKDVVCQGRQILSSFLLQK